MISTKNTAKEGPKSLWRKKKRRYSMEEEKVAGNILVAYAIPDLNIKTSNAKTDAEEVPEHLRGIAPDLQGTAAAALPFYVDGLYRGRIHDKLHIECKAANPLPFEHRTHECHVEQLEAALRIFHPRTG